MLINPNPCCQKLECAFEYSKLYIQNLKKDQHNITVPTVLRTYIIYDTGTVHISTTLDVFSHAFMLSVEKKIGDRKFAVT